MSKILQTVLARFAFLLRRKPVQHDCWGCIYQDIALLKHSGRKGVHVPTPHQPCPDHMKAPLSGLASSYTDD
jgi:hypothetical protein